MALDPVMFSTAQSIFHSIANEMGSVMLLSAYSSIAPSEVAQIPTMPHRNGAPSRTWWSVWTVSLWRSSSRPHVRIC